MITAGQTSATRAPLGLGQRALAELSCLSRATAQRRTSQHMDASNGVIRNVGSLIKPVSALAAVGVELVNDGQPSTRGGRGVRLIVQPAGP